MNAAAVGSLTVARSSLPGAAIVRVWDAATSASRRGPVHRSGRAYAHGAEGFEVVMINIGTAANAVTFITRPPFQP